MNSHIVILSGGLGSRLNNTENRPKPLVEINGKSLLTRLIESLNKTEVFKHFHIITCNQKDFFREVLKKEIPHINFTIHDEIKRTGRMGALKFFIDSQNNIDKFFVCNGDTLFLNLKQLELTEPIRKFAYNPIIFLAKSDSSRNDYKEINIKYNDSLTSFQNSGLIYISRKWILDKISGNSYLNDLDDFLFEDESSIIFSVLKTKILDGGTPARLSYIRGLIN
tara:strand:+ start:212 stop:880 length:669 start_codon:yes stop_codon:yes gene_type:complete